MSAINDLQTNIVQCAELIKTLCSKLDEKNSSEQQLASVITKDIPDDSEIGKLYGALQSDNIVIRYNLENVNAVLSYMNSSITKLNSTTHDAKNIIDALIEKIKAREYEKNKQRSFKKRFEYENTYVDFEVKITDDSNENYDFSEFKFTTPTFTYSIYDVNRERTTLDFLKWISMGINGNYTEFGPVKDRFMFNTSVGGNGGAADFSFSVPMSVAVGMHEIIKEADQYITSLNKN